MKIPVFHDDQHGTAIIVAAAVLNGLKLAGKDIGEVRLAGSGAGAAALSCLEMLVTMGVKRENIFASDIDGVVYKGRTVNMDPEKARFAQETSARTLAEILPGADIFLGLSAGNILTADMIRQMATDADHHGAGQSDAGDHAGSRARGPLRRTDLHRPFRLPEPGQQRAVLPLYLPGRARCRGDDHQRGDEEGGRLCDRRPRPRRSLRRRRDRLCDPTDRLWPGVSDPQAFRSAPDREDRAGRRPGRDVERRGDAAACPISRPIGSGSRSSSIIPAPA